MFDASAIAWIHAYRLANQVRQSKDFIKVAVLWSARFGAVIQFQLLSSEPVFRRDPGTFK